MNKDRIENALKEIEASLPAGKAQVRFDVYGGGVDESFSSDGRSSDLRVRSCRYAVELRFAGRGEHKLY